MTRTTDTVDFIALAQLGAALRTRDRRAVTIIALDVAAGMLRGTIAQEGELAWRRDGSFAAAPAGVAGPLDLMPPSTAGAAPMRASLKDALNENDGDTARGPFCCD